MIVCITTFREYILQNITSEMEIMHDRPEVTLSIKFQKSLRFRLFMAKRNLSTKSQFLTHELSNFHQIYTVEYFLEVILSSYRFKRDNFHSENFTSNLKHVYKVATIPNKRSPDHGCYIRLVERDSVPSLLI